MTEIQTEIAETKWLTVVVGTQVLKEVVGTQVLPEVVGTGMSYHATRSSFLKTFWKVSLKLP